jgi:hypothetical protein
MKPQAFGVATGCLVACMLVPALGRAQTAVGPAPVAVPIAGADERPAHDWATARASGEARRPSFPSTPQPDGSFWGPFLAIPNDFGRFFSAGTLKVLGVGGAGALAAHQWDDKGIEESQEHFDRRLFEGGRIGGSFLTQVGASFGVYSVARLSGSTTFSAAGADLLRAQMLAQGIVQAGKFATRRARPDGSNDHSLPSGHTASAFATAAVLQRHFGWKAGAPAYAFGAYVAASRMSANKHHLSDVVLGAALGIAAGRTVTVGSGKARFEMGVAPAPGGAAITLTKR